jgi:DNA-binding LacI/PurR family transcriptional regulator
VTIHRPTIRDVAHMAGVSHQTVSRVINRNERVSEETRQRVDAAIAELRYHPSAIARSMAHGKTFTLACISPNLTDFTFASLIEGAEIEARSYGYFLLSTSAPDAASFIALIKQLVDHRRVDGLLIINPYADGRSEYIPTNFPVVFIGSGSRGPQVCSVCLDDESTGYAATRHLLGLGRRKIAMITGPLVEECSRDRQKGYWRALEETGIDPGRMPIFEGDWSASSGYQALSVFKSYDPLTDAVFAQNDRMAMGVMHAARDLGLDIPGQFAVVGVDDMPLASYFDPPLTTMHQNMTLIGREAAQLLLAVIKSPHMVPVHKKIEAELVVRKSTVQC